MNSTRSNRNNRSFARLTLFYAMIWIVLMILLGITLGTAYLKLDGHYSAALHLGIAALQVFLLWLLFMDLLESSSLVRLGAAAGLFWITFLFALTFADYFTRSYNGIDTSLLSPRPEAGAVPDARLGPTPPLHEKK